MLDTSDLRAWYTEDILHITDALRLAHGVQGDGFDAALDAVCAAIGVKQQTSKAIIRQATDDNLRHSQH